MDDSANFKRIFGFSKPPDVRVVHSYYWRSSHWTEEYRYFIALEASSRFFAGLTSSELMTAAAPAMALLNRCGAERPGWFLPKPLGAYEAWIPKVTSGYRVFRDKMGGRLFVCDQRM